jgi:spore coat protein U-like protein
MPVKRWRGVPVRARNHKPDVPGLSVLASILFALPLTPALADAGTCSGSVTNIVFGTQTVTTMTGATMTGTVNASCPSGHGSYNPWAYCLNIGVGSNSVSQTNRLLKSGSNAVSYNLYVDSSYATPYTYLGNTIFTGPYSNSTGGTATTTVYAKILSSVAGIPPGTYTDSYTTATQAVVNSNGAPQTYSAAETCTGSTGVNWWNTSAFTVSLTLQASCTVSVSAMNFGTGSAPLTAGVSTTATITALCTSSTPYAIGLDNGTYASGSQRRMYSSAAGAYVNYGLYLDSALMQPWGGATSATTCSNGAGTCYTAGVGTGSNQTISIYGNVPKQAAAKPGSYSDTVTVSLDY